jgi:hypothetical protein
VDEGLRQEVGGSISFKYIVSANSSKYGFISEQFKGETIFHGDRPLASFFAP